MNTDISETRETIKNIITVILNQMVHNPGSVTVRLHVGEKTTLFLIDIPKEDFGRLLGTGGKNIQALRTLVTAMSATHGIRSVVQIEDEDRFF